LFLPGLNALHTTQVKMSNYEQSRATLLLTNLTKLKLMSEMKLDYKRSDLSDLTNLPNMKQKSDRTLITKVNPIIKS